MTSRWLSLLEAHIEKGVLGLAGAGLLYMLWAYGINSPNRVKYQNSELGPRELAEAIKSDADDLDRAVRNADMDPEKPEAFSDRLREQHDQGIFAASPQGGPPLEPELRLAAGFGRKIAVPGLKESEPAGSIVVVTPLKPSQPELRTGRSLALRQQYQLPGFEESSAAPPSDAKAEAEEVAWVTVAAYFDKKAQYNEMISAGYAPYRSKAYIVGLDVARQEVLSTGEYSEWQPVETTKAMPKLDLPEPVFDDQTGELSNKDEIRQTFATIKLAQSDLMQPPFYVVQGGDFWEVPPLAGYEDEEEDEEEEEEDLVAGGRRSGIRGPQPPGIGSGGRARGGFRGGGIRGGGGSRGSGGRGGGGLRGGGGGSPRAGGYNPGAGGRSDEQEKREARKAIRESLTEARKLLGQKEYGEARAIAERVLGDSYASKGDIRKAKDYVRTADRWLTLLEERAGGGRRATGRDAPELVTHPETATPAVWFHDDTVEAGKTYRYRTRAKLWNRYVGRVRAVKDTEQAKQPVIVGDWSLPSDPVTVTPGTYFFFGGARSGDKVASTDVWKWRKGRWIKERFEVTIGDVIGGVRNKKTGEYNEEGEEVRADIDFTTGAVVLDLRFDEEIDDRWPGADGVFSYRQKKSPVMVYLDPADGQVKEKVLLFDRNDPTHKELKDSAW